MIVNAACLTACASAVHNRTRTLLRKTVLGRLLIRLLIGPHPRKLPRLPRKLLNTGCPPGAFMLPSVRSRTWEQVTNLPHEATTKVLRLLGNLCRADWQTSGSLASCPTRLQRNQSLVVQTRQCLVYWTQCGRWRYCFCSWGPALGRGRRRSFSGPFWTRRDCRLPAPELRPRNKGPGRALRRSRIIGASIICWDWPRGSMWSPWSSRGSERTGNLVSACESRTGRP